MRVYSTKDRIKIKMDDVVVSISPLTYEQKKVVQEMLVKAQGKESLYMDASYTAIRFAVKDISGLTNANGEKYELEFEENILTEGCMDDLLNIEITSRMNAICMALVNGMPDCIINPETGEKMEGVEILNPQTEEKR